MAASMHGSVEVASASDGTARVICVMLSRPLMYSYVYSSMEVGVPGCENGKFGCP